MDNNGWRVTVFALVWCKGYASESLGKFLFAQGISNSEIKRITKESSEAAKRYSMQIFILRDKEWEVP